MTKDDDDRGLPTNLRLVRLELAKYTYRVSLESGECLGTYLATSEDDAIAQCVDRAGYASVTEAREQGYALTAVRV